MRRPSLIELIVAAAISSVLAYLFYLGGSLIFSNYYLVRPVIGVAFFSYMIVMMRCSGRRQGKALLATALIGLLVFSDFLSFQVFVGSLLVLLWIIRSSLNYRSLISAVLDGGLLGIGLVLSLATLNFGGSVIKALWVFFLIQSLAVFIPVSFGKKGEAQVAGGKSDFDIALNSANRALRELARA